MDLTKIERELIETGNGYDEISNINTEKIIEFINELKSVVFMKNGVKERLEKSYNLLIEILNNTENLNPTETTEEFFKRLPKVKETLQKDVIAFIHGDPACSSSEEVVLTYLSFFAIFTYRVAHELDLLGVKIVPRFLTEYAHGKTGIDINPKAKIGEYFFIDHGTGIVIGETTVIGDGVKLYQGVTLGAINLSHAEELKGVKRHPTIENGVIIYANATILGGNTVIGEDSVIGASCFITKSVDKGSKISFNIK